MHVNIMLMMSRAELGPGGSERTASVVRHVLRFPDEFVFVSLSSLIAATDCSHRTRPF